jgi:hypothetical protein
MRSWKIADATLLVRFGRLPRPAQRRPKVLLVAALEDDISDHVQRENVVAPMVEALREALLHALPASLRALDTLRVDFELEVRRSGPFSRGALQVPGLLNAQGKLALDFRSAKRLLAWVAVAAPWLFADAPSISRQPPPPRSAGYDATYLLIAGRTNLRAASQFTGCVAIEPEDSTKLRVVATGAVPGVGSESFSVSAADDAGFAAARAFGGEHAGPDEDDQRADEVTFA